MVHQGVLQIMETLDLLRQLYIQLSLMKEPLLINSSITKLQQASKFSISKEVFQIQTSMVVLQTIYKVEMMVALLNIAGHLPPLSEVTLS